MTFQLLNLTYGFGSTIGSNTNGNETEDAIIGQLGFDGQIAALFTSDRLYEGTSQSSQVTGQITLHAPEGKGETSTFTSTELTQILLTPGLYNFAESAPLDERLLLLQITGTGVFTSGTRSSDDRYIFTKTAALRVHLAQAKSLSLTTPLNDTLGQSLSPVSITGLLPFATSFNIYETVATNSLSYTSKVNDTFVAKGSLLEL